jgi:hypothetical protein
VNPRLQGRICMPTARPRRCDTRGSPGRGSSSSKQGRLGVRGGSGRALDRLAELALPALAGKVSRFGLGACAVVAEALGKRREIRLVRLERFLPASRNGPQADLERASRMFRTKAHLQVLSEVLGAFGNGCRLTILLMLLAGPATYQALQQAVHLKPGPLYYHITQLRLAGLLCPKARDLYMLTRGGRDALLLALLMGSVIDDTRSRRLPE